MSHFTVLVIGDDPEKQLAPYHEFECTGEDNEYVRDIDQTAEVRAEFEKDTVTRYKDPKGKLHDPYQDKFYRDPTAAEAKDIGPIAGTGGNGKGLSWTSKDWGDGKGYRAKIHFVPEGWKEVEVPRKEVESFREFVEDYHGKKVVPFGQKPDLGEKGEHKFGYALANKKGEIVKVVDRTNPDARWDWYQIGGRWTGFFKLKSPKPIGDMFTPELAGALAAKFHVPVRHVNQLAEIIRSGDAKKLDTFKKNALVPGGYHLEKAVTALVTPRYANARVGMPGLMTDIAKPGKADQALKRDIDFDGMRDEAADKAGQRYDRLAKLFGGEIPKITLSWDEVSKGDEDWDKKRKRYWAQPALKKLEAIRKRKDLSDADRDLVTWVELDEYQGGREAYVGRAIRDAISTFAVVKDGKWYEKGKMGWWCAVHNEKDQGKWTDELRKLLDSVPDDTLLTVVDCHI